MNTTACKSKQNNVRMKLKIFLHGFSNASVWYWATRRSELGENYAVDELQDLIMEGYSTKVCIHWIAGLWKSRWDNYLYPVRSLSVAENWLYNQSKVGCFIILKCESNVVVLQSLVETVLQSKTGRFKIQHRKRQVWRTKRNVSIFKIPWKLWQYVVFITVAAVAE
jgi:hypothetical protein